MSILHQEWYLFDLRDHDWSYDLKSTCWWLKSSTFYSWNELNQVLVELDYSNPVLIVPLVPLDFLDSLWSFNFNTQQNNCIFDFPLLQFWCYHGETSVLMSSESEKVVFFYKISCEWMWVCLFVSTFISSGNSRPKIEYGHTSCCWAQGSDAKWTICKLTY